MLRQRLVAIRYSHVRIEARPSKLLSPSPGVQQRVLEGILGVLKGSEHAVAVHL